MSNMGFYFNCYSQPCLDNADSDLDPKFEESLFLAISLPRMADLAILTVQDHGH